MTNKKGDSEFGLQDSQRKAGFQESRFATLCEPLIPERRTFFSANPESRIPNPV